MAEWTEDLDSRQATKRDLEDVARALGLPSGSHTVRSLRIMIRHALTQAISDRGDYERRWLAECRAHGDTQRKLALACHELGDHSLCGGDCSSDDS